MKSYFIGYLFKYLPTTIFVSLLMGILARIILVVRSAMIINSSYLKQLRELVATDLYVYNAVMIRHVVFLVCVLTKDNILKKNKSLLYSSHSRVALSSHDICQFAHTPNNLVTWHYQVMFF